MLMPDKFTMQHPLDSLSGHGAVLTLRSSLDVAYYRARGDIGGRPP